MRKLSVIISAFMLCLTMTACGSGKPASAPSVADNDKAIVQEKLDKDETKTETTATDDEKQVETTEVTSEKTEEQTSNGTNILVAYFSRADENYSVGTIEVGNTQILGEYIANEVGADSFHIETVTPYAKRDTAVYDMVQARLLYFADRSVRGKSDKGADLNEKKDFSRHRCGIFRNLSCLWSGERDKYAHFVRGSDRYRGSHDRPGNADHDRYNDRFRNGHGAHDREHDVKKAEQKEQKNHDL